MTKQSLSIHCQKGSMSHWRTFNTGYCVKWSRFTALISVETNGKTVRYNAARECSSEFLLKGALSAHLLDGAAAGYNRARNTGTHRSNRGCRWGRGTGPSCCRCLLLLQHVRRPKGGSLLCQRFSSSKIGVKRSYAVHAFAPWATLLREFMQLSRT